jgi:hypothetical protein
VYNGETSQWENTAWQPDGVVKWCYNPSLTETIAANTVVYATGGTNEYGDLNVAPASNDDTTGMVALGVTQGQMGPEGYGSVCLIGALAGNTSAFTAGATLWLGVDGVLTATEPTAATSLVRVGTVITSAADGHIMVHLSKTLVQTAPTILSGTSAPSNSVGNNGDIFAVYTP